MPLKPDMPPLVIYSKLKIRCKILKDKDVHFRVIFNEGPWETTHIIYKQGLVKHIMVYSCAKLCPTLCNPMDCSSPDSSVHGILQARILEWVTISFSRGSSWPRDQTHVSCVTCIAGRFFTTEPHKNIVVYSYYIMFSAHSKWYKSLFTDLVWTLWYIFKWRKKISK